MNYKLILLNKIKAPATLIKIIIISIIFTTAINIELDVLKTFSIKRVGSNDLNCMVFIVHIFTYFEVYAKYLIVGLILLIPDIIDEPYLTHQIFLSNKNRSTLFKHVIKLISIYIASFILWFIFLTLIVSLPQLKVFDFLWPSRLFDAMYNSGKLILISIPESAMKYPLPLVLILIIFRTMLGFFILSLASFYISFKKNNVGYGIGLVILIYVISDLLYLFGDTTFNLFNNPDKVFSLSTIAYKYSLVTFFTFQNVGVDFTSTMIHSILYGALVILVLLILIYSEIQRKDLC